MTYHIEVQRDGRWWMVHIPEIGGLTQARRLAEVEQMAREFIAVSTGTPIADVDVAVSSVTADGIDVSGRARHIAQDRARAEDHANRAKRDATKLARDLAAHGVPIRDVGEVLGVSFQRAQQLIST